MKKRFLKITSVVMASLMLSTQILFAAPVTMDVPDKDVNFDMEAFEEDFASLGQIEEMVLSEGITHVDQLAGYNLKGVDIQEFAKANSAKATQGFDWNNFDWPSGLWGFLCCPIGFFVVITNKDKSSDQKTSFWIGLAAGVVLSGIPTALFYGRIRAIF